MSNVDDDIGGRLSHRWAFPTEKYDYDPDNITTMTDSYETEEYMWPTHNNIVRRTRASQRRRELAASGNLQMADERARTSHVGPESRGPVLLLVWVKMDFIFV